MEYLGLANLVKELNLEKLIGISTNLAVIAGIWFLVAELQQNNTLLSLEARHAASSARREIVLTNMNNEALIEARSKASKSEPLSETEQTQILLYFFATFRTWQDYFNNYLSGVVSEAEIQSEVVNWRRTLGIPYIAHEWNRHRHELDPTFVEYVEN